MENVFFWVAFAFSVIMHEYVHGWVAYKLGDPTAHDAGRLTLNPIPHIDPIMTVVVPAALYYFSGGKWLLGGAKPVPVNPLNFRNPRQGMMLVGITGPLTNLAIGACFAALLHLLNAAGIMNDVVAAALIRIVFINGILAFFNMVPIPPLDGSRVVSWLLPRDLARSYDRIGPFGLFLVIPFMYLVGFGLILPAVIAYCNILGIHG